MKKIVVEINSESGINILLVQKLGKCERSDKRIFVAEDSPVLRKLLNDTLAEAGFEYIEFFDNGKDIVKSGKNIEEQVHLVVTGIEMAQMDGHHLTKRIKESKELAILPSLFFHHLLLKILSIKDRWLVQMHR